MKQDLKTPKWKFYATSSLCDCPANKEGECMLPIRVHVRDPESGGWWSGSGVSFYEALLQAIERSPWKEYKLTTG